MNDVILVDERDREIGTMEKLEAHEKGRLHRSFSIFIFHPDGRMLLQRRAAGKYHSAGLWSNACCSHPRPGEKVMTAAHRRLKEEMGFDCDLHETHSFIYHAPFPNGLTEHEYDHVLVGVSDEAPAPDSEEADDWVWMGIPELRKDMDRHPEDYTYWLRTAFEGVMQRA